MKWTLTGLTRFAWLANLEKAKYFLQHVLYLLCIRFPLKWKDYWLKTIILFFNQSHFDLQLVGLEPFNKQYIKKNYKTKNDWYTNIYFYIFPKHTKL